MTRRLFEEDAYRKEFDATVLRCTEEKAGWAVVPDASAFYPEGGGQSGDRGSLILLQEDGKTLRVLDTQEEGEDIVLLCDGPAKAGTRVHGCIDWAWRFDRMQNHSGEHIVSGLCHERFGCNNVGFHMGEESMTVDLDKEIPEEALEEIEDAANRIVWDNRPVEIAVYTEQEAAQVTYRSKKELHGSIRVVTIPGADACACCGTHVAFTGEIGPIRILSQERFRGGTRIEMACGRWAHDLMSVIRRQNKAVSVLLSSPQSQTKAAVKRILEEESALKERFIALQYELLERTARELQGEGDILLFAGAYTPKLLQKLADRMMQLRSGCVLIFSGTDETGYQYVIGQTGGDLRDLGKALNAALSGRGGGRPNFLQGSVTAARSEIEAYLKSVSESLQIASV